MNQKVLQSTSIEGIMIDIATMKTVSFGICKMSLVQCYMKNLLSNMNTYLFQIIVITIVELTINYGQYYQCHVFCINAVS